MATLEASKTAEVPDVQNKIVRNVQLPPDIWSKLMRQAVENASKDQHTVAWHASKLISKSLVSYLH